MHKKQAFFVNYTNLAKKSQIDKQNLYTIFSSLRTTQK